MRAVEIQEIIETVRACWIKAAGRCVRFRHKARIFMQGEACRRSVCKLLARSMGRREEVPGGVCMSAGSGKDFYRRKQDDEQNDEADDFPGQASGRFSIFAPVASAAFHAAGAARTAG